MLVVGQYIPTYIGFKEIMIILLLLFQKCIWMICKRGQDINVNGVLYRGTQSSLASHPSADT